MLDGAATSDPRGWNCSHYIAARMQQYNRRFMREAEHVVLPDTGLGVFVPKGTISASSASHMSPNVWLPQIKGTAIRPSWPTYGRSCSCLQTVVFPLNSSKAKLLCNQPAAHRMPTLGAIARSLTSSLSSASRVHYHLRFLQACHHGNES